MKTKLMHPITGKPPGWAAEMQAIQQAYQSAGGDPENLRAKDVATLVVSGDQVLASHEVPGIEFVSRNIENGIQAEIRVKAGQVIEKPVHLCFGIVPEEGIQRILAHYEIEDGASVSFLAHCFFPNAL